MDGHWHGLGRGGTCLSRVGGERGVVLEITCQRALVVQNQIRIVPLALQQQVRMVIAGE